MYVYMVVKEHILSL